MLATGKGFWITFIGILLVVLVVRYLGVDHTMYLLRGLFSDYPSPKAIGISILLLFLCIWALSGKPKTP